MRKNGFTLIELLAVIVILAIIALIATPIVLNIIEDTKNSATLRSADFYLDAVELSITEKVLEGGTIDGEYTINSSGNICKNEECIEVEVQGQKPTSGKITIEDGKIKSIYKLTLGGKTISTDSNGELAIKKYSTYNITYENTDNTSGLPVSVEEGDNAEINLTGKNIPANKLKVYIDGELTTNYTYENYILTIPNPSGNITIIVGEKYIVSYTNIEDTTGLPTNVLEGGTLEIDLTGKNISAFKVYMGEEEVTDYTYENNIITITNVSGDVAIVVIPEPVSFEDDSWETIIANVQAGNTDAYIVGAEKEITLTSDDDDSGNADGFTTGTYIVRLANKTANDSEGVCANSTYSQTACGFVIEFVDIITTHNMNPAGEYKGTQYNNGWSVDGWPASNMRKFVTPVYDDNDVLIEDSGTIYNAIEDVVRNAIIDTRVVSGYEKNKRANYTSTDKLYLLSTKEVSGTASSYDKVSSETRQLDYYSSSEAIKIKYLNGTATNWWLRSANYSATGSFYIVNTSGDRHGDAASKTNGVAVAFRLG